MLSFLVRSPRVAQRVSSRRRRPAEPGAGAQEADEPSAGCGWFDSSRELRLGLKVVEHMGFERLPPEVPPAWMPAA